jgi:hypothetical protein
MKTNELIALLQRIEHHNGGPLEVVIGQNRFARMQAFNCPDKDNPDTANLIQAGSGSRPRVAIVKTEPTHSITII